MRQKLLFSCWLLFRNTVNTPGKILFFMLLPVSAVLLRYSFPISLCVLELIIHTMALAVAVLWFRMSVRKALFMGCIPYIMYTPFVAYELHVYYHDTGWTIFLVACTLVLLAICYRVISDSSR